MCIVLSDTIAKFLKRHKYTTDGKMWTSTLTTVITTSMKTDRYNTQSNNNCKAACVLKRGCGVSLRPTESSTGVVVGNHELLRHKNVILVSIFSVQSSLTL